MQLRDLCVPGIAGLKPYEPGKPIDELERELGISDSIKLASNENPFGPSPKALAAAQEALQEVALYPDGNGFALKQALAGRLGVDAGNITLGNGSNEILELVGRLFLMPGTQAMFARHSFAVYPIVTQACGAEALITPVDAAYRVDLDAMLGKLSDRVRVIFIANPNNPTGTWLHRNALRDFIERVPPQVVVVIDEAYFEYVDEDAYGTAMDWLGEYPNIIVTRTFSKIYGLAGLRIGYAVSSPELAELLNRVRQPFNTNLVAQAAALAALGDDEHVNLSATSNRSGLQLLQAGCERLGLGWIESVGNFLCIDFGREAMPLYDALLRQGVIVRPVANYGLPNHLRVTIGSKAENERFLAALEAVL